jgi:outer membrane biosynthesis protein TonB
MKIALSAALVALVSLYGPAVSQTAPKSPPRPVPPPIVLSPPAVTGNSVLSQWAPDAITCGEEHLPIATIAPIKPELGWPVQPQNMDMMGRASLDFAIDAGGRPVDIVRSPASGYAAYNSDLAPALAVSRFPAGQARDACHVSFALKQTPLAYAAPADLMAASIYPQMQMSREMVDRMKPAGSTCFKDSLAPLMRAFPDFTKMKPMAGRPNWSMVQFDIDDSGKPIAVKTVAGSGNPELDAASRTAVAQSRFSGGRRSGCLYPYRQNAAPAAPPAMPEKAALAVEGATCPTNNEWATKPTLTFPANYRRRAVEGWAIIGFDVAPWGATGNIRVLRAEPSAEFGDAGAGVIRGAVMAKSERGYVGCVERVLYVMSGHRADDEPAY